MTKNLREQAGSFNGPFCGVILLTKKTIERKLMSVIEVPLEAKLTCYRFSLDLPEELLGKIDHARYMQTIDGLNDIVDTRSTKAIRLMFLFFILAIISLIITRFFIYMPDGFYYSFLFLLLLIPITVSTIYSARMQTKINEWLSSENMFFRPQQISFVYRVPMCTESPIVVIDYAIDGSYIPPSF